MRVYMGKCRGYGDVGRIIEEGVESIGGVGRFVKPGEKILVNPNLLKGSPPEEAVVTHPDFIIEVIRSLEEAGADVIVGDSPGGRYSEGSLRKAYERSGWTRIEEETDARLNYDVGRTRISFKEGRVLKSIPVLSVYEGIDGVVNLPKLKTHGLTVFTGAVKNMYGMVPGLTKSAFHGQYRGLNRFSKVLMDVHDAVSPKLSIMDGVLGMKGKDGPSGGDPVRSEMVVISEDAYACDIAACRAVGIPPEKVTTLGEDQEDVEYVGLEPDDFDLKIEYPEGGQTPWWAPESLGGILSNIYLDRPKLKRELCNQCGSCREICPEGALEMKDYGPKISWWKCIRCYCCAEVCPQDALEVE